MKAHYIRNIDLNQLVDLDADFWNRIKPQQVSMQQTPVALQPTAAIRQEWADKDYGMVHRVAVSAAHNGRFIAFRLQWYDAEQDLQIHDNNGFVDAAAIMLGAVPGAPIMLMGEAGKPVNALYWRADAGKTGRNVVAEGIGTSRTIDTELILCNDQWQDNTWSLIIARPLQINTDESIAQLSPGYETPYGVAIWAGSGGERAGIKSVGLGLENLVIEAVA